MSLMADVQVLRAEFTLINNSAGTAAKIKESMNAIGMAGAGAAKGGLSLAEKGMTGIGNAANHAKQFLGGMLSSVGMLAGPVGILGLAGAIDYTAKAAIDFEQQMKMIQTQAGGSAQEVATMSKALLEMAASVGTGPEELAKGLYHLESAGFRGAVALNALRIGAEGARVGNADLESVMNALDAVMVAGGPDAKNMAASMGELNAIVGAGDMRMQDLADAMGTGLLGVARTFGVTLKDVGAALATFGDNNIRGADAATKVRQAIITMGAPSKAAAKQLASIGLSATQLADDLRNKGLVAALQDLKDHLDKAGLTASQQAAVISHAFGGGRTGVAIMLLLSQLDRVKQKETEIGTGATQFGADWAATTQTTAQKLANFSAAIQSVAISIGDAILPTLTDFAQGVATAIQKNQTAIVGFVNKVVKVVREMGNFVAQTLIPTLEGIGKAAKGAWDQIPAPLRTLLVQALIANKVIKTVFGINIMGSIEGAIGNKIGGMLGGIFSKGGSPVNPLFVKDVGGLGGAAGNLAGDAATGGGLVGSIVSGVKLALVGFVLPELVLNQIKGFFPGVGNAPGGGNTLPIGGFSGADNNKPPQGPQPVTDTPALHILIDTAKQLAAAQAANQMTLHNQILSEHNDAAKAEAFQAKAFANLTGLTKVQLAIVAHNIQLQTVAAALHHRETFAQLLHTSHIDHMDHISTLAKFDHLTIQQELTKQATLRLLPPIDAIAAAANHAAMFRPGPTPSYGGGGGLSAHQQHVLNQGGNHPTHVTVSSARVTQSQNTQKRYGPVPL